MKKRLLFIYSFLCCASLLWAQKPIEINVELAWGEPEVRLQPDGRNLSVWKFARAVFSDEYPALPLYLEQFSLPSYGELQVEVLEVQTAPLTVSVADPNELIGESLDFKTGVEQQRNQFFGKLIFCPIVRTGSAYERVERLRLRILHRSMSPPIGTRLKNKTNSVLRDGDIYKIAVRETGVHKLTYTFLKDQLGIPIDNVDPRTIKVYGNGGGMVPSFIQTERIDDLEENHIFVAGESDGNFGSGDYILFYGQGPDRWFFNEEKEIFEMEKNIYDDANYYFIKIGPGNGARVDTQSDLSTAQSTVNTFDDFARHEIDKVNLLHEWNLSQGSGQQWFGDHFKVVRAYDYDRLFTFPNLVTEIPAKIETRMALRATERGYFRLEVAGQSLQSELSGRVSKLTDNLIDYARSTKLEGAARLTGDNVSLRVSYPNPGGSGDGSEGWLDYIQFNVRRRLIMSGNQLGFRNIESRSYASVAFELGGANANTQIWEITDPLHPATQEVRRDGSTLRFGRNTAGVVRQFVAFDQNAALLTAEAVGKIENQNLHALNNTDMVILYHADFEEAAARLAQHRVDFSDLAVSLVRVDHVYNEFSSGRQDPTAIRDFAKMLYDRGPRFKYLLLFGDGSFDARNRYELGNNFIPVFEKDDFNPLFTFPSDDYFGLLTNDNPNDPLAGALNVAVGRLPVATVEEADALVRKIIHYDTNPSTLGDWRNRIVFIGDDEDGNFHIRDADRIADRIDATNPFLNIDKIYLDAYLQESTPGGDRYPDVTNAINQSIFRGALVMTYLGHGGSRGWAQERILNISDITGWDNLDRQPLFMTATCSFTGYDDAGFVTAGEKVILNERGGAIALMTTVRAVYASLNAELTEEALEELFNRQGGDRIPTLGDAILRAKNNFSGSTITTNSRKFALIGDPAQHLTIPQYQVQTTHIDDQPVAQVQVDTLGALQKVKVRGVITDATGQIVEDFNGIIFPTVFDKQTTISTLGQDSDSRVFDFKVQKNIIFKGRATVSNGRFEYTFIVPKDINYRYGMGKISYYASDQAQMLDAAGSYEDIVIGGTNPDAFRDDQGPTVDVFMNSTDFVFGGVTNENPTLLVKLRDDNGINVVGNSIGHDLEAVLDDDTQNSLLLNDFYESELDDFTQGEVRYPLSGLEEGLHTIRVKAWDVANNSAEGYTEFVVAGSGEVALEHVLNYPNPFTDFTCFQFDHNLVNQQIDVLVRIYTISGRLVKTLESTLFSDGAIRQDNCIRWDGRDDFGDPLGRGVYLYQVKVRSANGAAATLSGESSFEKLVILK